MSLPFEIREKIYALSLITNSVIAPCYFPFEECDHGYFLDLRREPLAINLLAANKVIRNEAASILISKNTWYVSYAAIHDTITSSPEIPGTSQSTFRRTVWQTHQHLFRHVVMGFHYRDRSHTAGHAANFAETIIQTASQATLQMNPHLPSKHTKAIQGHTAHRFPRACSISTSRSQRESSVLFRDAIFPRPSSRTQGPNLPSQSHLKLCDLYIRLQPRHQSPQTR